MTTMKLTVYVPDDVLFYKGVNKDLTSPQRNTRLTYTPGTKVKADTLDHDPTKECAAGINFCRTLAEALKWGKEGTVVTIKPIGGIVDTGGKLRAASVEVVSVVNLIRANLHGANLSCADLHSANLYGANLSVANLYGANLYGANLIGANLSGANLRRANLRCADLHGANLSCANLSVADLYCANLHGADLRSADLSGANLTVEKAKARGAIILP
jgi:uncharacterized protein YjbI with pentapeptide repeats